MIRWGFFLMCFLLIFTFVAVAQERNSHICANGFLFKKKKTNFKYKKRGIFPPLFSLHSFFLSFGQFGLKTET